MVRRFIWVTVSKHQVFAWVILIGLIYLLSLPESYHLAVLSTAVLPQEVRFNVMIDPGHGGIDSGGIGPGEVYEKDIVLDIALRLRDFLEKRGIIVGMTRASDTDVSQLASIRGTRYQRDLNGRFLAMHEGAVGISIHANVTKDPGEKGAIVFYMRDSYIDQIYANIILEQLEKVQILNHPEPIARSNLLLLKAKPPVLLVEVGFLSNASDLAKLTDPQFRQVLAEAIGQGMIDFLNFYRLEQSE
ncbi:MAG: N-acetylmuramoyl-L-alanine amidase [Firmicutes bacterium]|nr:N-acetylmuramoyl-L-alanine amidase [Bacillota bacterium]NLL87889.1 N-acetylmuramoyl-L-alanine amidase [Bacillota bacterium]